MRSFIFLNRNMIGEDELVPGDHIYRPGKGWIYSHHGIYMGEKEVKESGFSSSKSYKTVIHYTRTESGGKESSSSSSEPCRVCNYKNNLQRGVVETCLNCFLLAGQEHIYLYEYGASQSKKLFSRSGTCSTALSGPPSDVKDLASRLLIADLFGRYNLLLNNCENFAHFCRTGRTRSLQVQSLTNASLSFVVYLMLFPIKEIFTLLIMWANGQGYISTEHATAKLIDASIKLISLLLFIYLFILLGDIRESHMHSFFILEKLKEQQGDYQPPRWLINACKMWEQVEPPQWLSSAWKMPGQEEVNKSMFDYIGFSQKVLKAFGSEHLKASVLENIENQVGQTGEENKLGGHIKTFRDTLESGDHIYRFGQGKIHTHHGIYIGEDTVIHYTRTEEGEKESSSSKTCPVCQYRSDLHRGVIKTCLDCFLAGQDQIYWYAYGVSRSVASSFPVGSYSTKQSRPPSKAVDCASHLLEGGVKDYNLFFNNCEDFALFCKTRDPKSSQTDNVRNSLRSFTENIIKLAAEMDYFGLGGPASVKVFVLFPLLFLLIFVSLLFLSECLCSSVLKHLGLIFRWLKQLCFKFCRRIKRFQIETLGW